MAQWLKSLNRRTSEQALALASNPNSLVSLLPNPSNQNLTSAANVPPGDTSSPATPLVEDAQDRNRLASVEEVQQDRDSLTVQNLMSHSQRRASLHDVAPPGNTRYRTTSALEVSVGGGGGGGGGW